jgi:hypothetical protein
MKRVTEEVSNDHQPAKKVKVDLDHTQNVNGHDANVHGWSKVEKKKKKKEAKGGMGTQNVSRSSSSFGFITPSLHDTS